MVHLSSLSAALLAASQLATASTLPASDTLALRDNTLEHVSEDILPATLEKRRGGGGRGGGSSGGSTSSSGSSSGSRSGSSTGSTSGGSSGAGSRVSPTSNTGGRTISGTGPRPPYAGGSYAGGATQPYRSGATSYAGLGLAGGLLLGSSLAFFPGLWLYGAYQYDWRDQVSYFNMTSNNQMRAYVTCLCAQYQECGCDENNSTFVEQVIGNGSYQAMLANGVVYLPNGSPSIRRASGTIVINATLPNGTTAAGGTDDGTGSGAAGGRSALLQQAGWWSTGVLGVTMALML